MTGRGKTVNVLRVLSVGDDEDDMLLLEREVIRGGYTPLVTRADSSGAMNVALCGQTWDLVLSDWALSRFNGLFALELLKCKGLDVPFSTVSGPIGEAVAIAAIKAGAHDCVMRSDLERLMSVIRWEFSEANDRRSGRQVNAVLAAYQGRLKLITRATNDAIWDWTIISHAFWWDESAQALFGCRFHEMQPGMESWCSRLHPEEMDWVIALHYVGICGVNETWSDQYRFRRANGTYAPVLDRGYVLRNKAGVAVLAVGTVVDLTGQKQPQAEEIAADARPRDLTLWLERAKEEERTRIERELQDEFGQQLTLLKLDVASLAKQFANGAAALRPEVTEQLRSIQALEDHSIHPVHTFASSLRPSILDDFGLVSALQWQVREFEAHAGIPCDTTLSQHLSQRELDADRSTAIFRIAQELLTNIMRHAHASRARLTFCEEWDGLLLVVCDDGCGIAEWEGANQTTLGLGGLRERVAPFGSTLQITGGKGKGTTVRAWIPLGAEHAEN